MPQGNLPPKAREIFNAAEASAKKGACKDAGDRKDECVARHGWAAVKKSFKKVGDKWVPKANLQHFSMAITKAVQPPDTGKMLWRAVASDTDPDSYLDEMTLELFSDFVNKIESEVSPYEQYCSDFWSGGMPYLSVSHYPDMNGKAVPGNVDKVFMDGSRLKALGEFSDTPLGRACYKSVRQSIYSEEKSDTEDKVRISIAFLDMKHKHKETGFVFERSASDDLCPECFTDMLSSLLVDDFEPSGKQFMKGHLVHLAMTRVPVNKRTEMEMRSMDEILTREGDAASIVGKDLAEELQESLEETLEKTKSLVSLVVKSEEDVTKAKAEAKKSDEDEDEEDEKRKKEKRQMSKSDVTEIIKSVMDEVRAEQEDEPKHILDETIDTVKATYDKALESGDFETLKSSYVALGEVISAGVNKPEDVEVTVATEVAKALEKVLEPIVQQLALVSTQISNPGVVKTTGIPVPRNIQPSLQMQQDVLQPTSKSKVSESETPSIRALVERNTDPQYFGHSQ